jgi:DNA invertase Pin-like site-specific DNA recombinase
MRTVNSPGGPSQGSAVPHRPAPPRGRLVLPRRVPQAVPEREQPKLSPRQQRELVRMADAGEYTIADLAELFTVSRTTVYRTLQRDTATAEQDRR